MDIVSHGLWAGAAAKMANRYDNKKKRKPLNFWLAGFFGIFPDLFAFAIPFAWFFYNMIFGKMSFSDFPKPEQTEPPWPENSLLELSSGLYNISHSAIIFILVFALAWIIFKKPRFEMFGWLLHILMDIPTHSYKFFPTPVFWPISDWKFNGFSWANPSFLFLNYLTLFIIFIWLKKRKN